MKVLFYLIWYVLLGILQPTLARGIAICAITPNLFLCFAVVCGFYRGKYEGAVCGALSGLVYDLLIGRLIGVNCLIYLYVGFLSGVLSQHYISGIKRTACAVFAAISTLATGLVYYAAYKIAYTDISFATAFFRITLPEAVYNIFISLCLSYPIVRTMKLMKMDIIS